MYKRQAPTCPQVPGTYALCPVTTCPAPVLLALSHAASPQKSWCSPRWGSIAHVPKNIICLRLDWKRQLGPIVLCHNIIGVFTNARQAEILWRMRSCFNNDLLYCMLKGSARIVDPVNSQFPKCDDFEFCDVRDRDCTSTDKGRLKLAARKPTQQTGIVLPRCI